MVTLLAAATPFFFEGPWNKALVSADPLVTTVQDIAYGILAMTFLLGVYEAYFRQGSVRELGITILKYAVASSIVFFWNQGANGGFFGDITTGFNGIAHALDKGSITDIASGWMVQLSEYSQHNGNSVFSFTAGISISGLLAIALVMIGYVCYWIAMVLFTLIYVFWGMILYVMGPLFIALMPCGAVSNHAKTFATRLAEWATWPILFSLMGSLFVALNLDNTEAILNNSGLGSLADNVTNVIFVSLTTVAFAICLIIIPFIAHSLIAADFMGVFGPLAAAGIKAAKIAAAAATGGSSLALDAVGGAGGGSLGGSGMLGGQGGGSGQLPDSPPSTPPPKTDSVNRMIYSRRM